MSAAGWVSHSAQVASALGLAQMETTDANVDDAVRTAALWLQRHAGFSPGAVADLGRVNRCMRRYPRLAGAFIDGDLTASVIDRIIPRRYRGDAPAAAVSKIVEVQSELITAAES